jgi:hypothetical protein
VCVCECASVNSNKNYLLIHVQYSTCIINKMIMRGLRGESLRFLPGLLRYNYGCVIEIYTWKHFLVWLLLHAHRHRSILGVTGHIILTPATNQLIEE